MTLTTQAAAADAQRRHDALPDLSGRVAVVTGGSAGLGRATAQTLAGAGARVAVLGRRPEPLSEAVEAIRRGGGDAVSVTCDVADPAAVARAAEDVVRKLGPIDVLVNNAAVLTPLGLPWEVDPDEWWRTFEVNVRGPFLFSRAVVPGMLARGGGRVINIISGAAGSGPAYASAYANSKATLAQFTRSLAAGGAQGGVCAFAVDPGSMTTETGMQQILHGSEDGRRYFPSFQKFHAEGKGVPPERSARLIAILASGAADALSGRVIAVQDDLDALIGRADEIVRDNLLVLRVQKERDERGSLRA